jgi:hypothetical protein
MAQNEPFEVGLVSGRQQRSAGIQAAWFQDPSQVHREPSNGKGIKKSSAMMEFRVRETPSWQVISIAVFPRQHCLQCCPEKPR